ncbi:MAG: thiamine pyrophosphate-binding protein [Actinobacteria bacterium]|nr:thiamine pyrophosphate-binding protein [Actinomycetota bacterium]
MSEQMTGGQALARALIKMGTSRVYGIIGTSNVAFVDALYEVKDRVRYISCRHEQVAASLADAEGRLTGRPGVVLVHSGPGALNAMISAGNAYKDCSPMLIITGTVKRRLARSDGMLELDHRRIFAPLCKGTYLVERASDIPEIFSSAYRDAMSGARGPALIEVPEDVWLETAEVELGGVELAAEPPPPVKTEDVEEALEMLKSAELPLLLSGGGVAYSGSDDLLLRLAEALSVPVVTTGNGRGTMPESHPLSLGRVGFGGGNAVADKALEKATALLCLGAGLSDMTTYEYTVPIITDKITVVNISEGSISPQAPPCKLVLCDVKEFLGKALEVLGDLRSQERASWDTALVEVRSLWESMKEASLAREGEYPPAGRIMKALSGKVPDDTIVSVGAGMHLLFPMAFMPCNHPLTFLSTVNFGSMGFGLAASMAAKLVFPERTAVAILGDGDFMMTVQDLETAVREGIGIKVFVLNDCQYRVLNIRQRLQFQGRICGTEHGNPDFAELARCFGAAGYRLEKDGQIDDVLDEVIPEDGPVVVDLPVDPEDLPPLNIEANLRMSASP